MAFTKIGNIFKIENSHVLSSYSEWEQFKKTASSITKEKTAKEKEAVDKEAEFQIVADVDPDKFIYIHSTIMAGVKTEKNGYWITPDTEKFINENNDSWSCEDLLNDYKTFRRATTFVEHDQNLERAKGKCIDVIARPMPDTILIDVLFSIDKEHKDLVRNIINGIINAVSMGCTTEYTKCSICGNEAKTAEQYCTHIKLNNRGRLVKCSDGKTRKAAEVCKNNTFFDVSLVANPAFAGAVFRKILSSEQISNHLLANILTRKIEGSFIDNNLFLKAASKENEDEISIKLKDGKITVNASGKEISESIPKEEINKLQDMVQKMTDNMTTVKFSTTPATETVGTSSNSITINVTAEQMAKPKNLLATIIEKLFNKKSTHPIENLSGQKDFGISDQDFSSIPYSNPHNIKDDFAAQDEQIAKLIDKFNCYNCGFESELWQAKAASIDLGQNKVFVCPKCSFITESELLGKISYSTKFNVLSNIDKLQLTDLGYSDCDISKLSSEQIGSIIKNDIKKEANTDLQKLDSEFIAKNEIPVEDDDGTLWYEPEGDSVITKGEHLTFVKAVEHDAWGLFRTEDNRDVYLPIEMK